MRQEVFNIQGESQMGSVIAGLVLIGIGLAMGGSIFRGDFSLVSVFFDGLGIFWIARGVLGMVRDRAT